jgi:hypothetical protein
MCGIETQLDTPLLEPDLAKVKTGGSEYARDNWHSAVAVAVAM